MLHALAPLVIIVGVLSFALGVFWIIGSDTEQNDGPDGALLWVFGLYYLGLRFLRQLATDPISVIPGLGFMMVGVGLVYLGLRMW